MRILLWHGYLLGGTGSNVYTRQLARAWSLAGHDVTVLSQDPDPAAYDLGGARTVRPDAGTLLPVFVLDRYEGHEARLIGDCTPAELDRWVAANAAAVADLLPADLVFANHVLLGGPVGRASGARFAVKAHGSELEYAMRGNARLATWGAECLRDAAATFVGSAHIRRVLGEVCGPVERVHEVPPGVDIDDWVPRDRAEALDALLGEARRDEPNPGNARERLPDEGNARRLEAFLRDDRPTVVYFGKLMRNKGVHLLLEALRDGDAPRNAEARRSLDARAVIVGFGDDRAALEAMAQAAGAGPNTLFTGPLEHRHLVHLLALADACVVPSIFPEAFGMVAAEAAAAGCPPLVARHSGLAEIAAGLEAEYPPQHRHLAAFESGDAADLRDEAARAPRPGPGRPRGRPRRRPPRRRHALELDERGGAPAGPVAGLGRDREPTRRGAPGTRPPLRRRGGRSPPDGRPPEPFGFRSYLTEPSHPCVGNMPRSALAGDGVRSTSGGSHATAALVGPTGVPEPVRRYCR